MPLLWRSSRESRSERCKRAFLLAPICEVLLAPTLVSDRATIIWRTGTELYSNGASTTRIISHDSQHVVCTGVYCRYRHRISPHLSHLL